MLWLVLGICAATEPDATITIESELTNGYYSKALAMLEPLMKSADTRSRLRYLHGSALLGLKKTDEALTEVQAAIKTDPTNAPLYRLLGEIDAVRTQDASLFAKPGLANTTLKAFQTAVQLSPEDAESQLDLTRYYINAPSIVGGGKDRATQQILVLAKLNPVYAARTRAEVALIDDKDFNAAEQALRQAVALDSTPDSMLELGLMDAGNQHPKEALDTFKTMTARFPGKIAGWYWLGRCAALAKADYATGISAMAHYLAAKQRPDDAPPTGWADLRLAELFELSGDAPSARGALADARADAPANDAAFGKELDRIAAAIR